MNAARLLTVAFFGLSLSSVCAKTIRIEFLQGNFDQKNAFIIDGLACRNLDKIVHLNIALDWPEGTLSKEDKDNVDFWTNRGESDSDYRFPSSKVEYRHGSYLISGYFIIRSGGTHQGITGMGFQAIDDATVMLNPSVKEIPARRAYCGK
jgi:hypothetical protein